MKYRERSIADVLAMTVDEAAAFFADEPAVRRALQVLRQVGLGTCAWASRPPSFGRRSPAHQARHRAAAPGARRYALCAGEPTTGLHPPMSRG